jgi:hypothetical protein
MAGIPARRRLTRTAFAVRPIRAATSASGIVPSKANSSVVHQGPW